MKTLLVQDYLRSGKTLEDLKVEHGVYSYISNGKIGLSYDMIEAKESDQLSQQCRGLILEENTYDQIAVPFFRFFNYGQETLTPKDFDWNSAKYQEKMDGTLIVTYNYKDHWYVGTRSRPDADGRIDDTDLTFAHLVDITIKKQFEDINNINDLMNNYFNSNAKEYTFCFELVSPLNRIVCKYDEPRLYLLFSRHNNTLDELSPELWVTGSKLLQSNLKTPILYEFKNINHMVQVIKEWNPENHEGVVCIDKNFNRIKVKNPSYVAYNKMRDSLSTSMRGCLEVILLGKDDDVVGMMPDMIADRIRTLKPQVQEVFLQTEKDYLKLKEFEDMKTFALEAQKCLWPAALFALKRGKTPDLKTFAMGRDELTVPNSSLDHILGLCKKISN